MLLTLPTTAQAPARDWIRRGEHLGYWSQALSHQLRLARDQGQLEALLKNLAQTMRQRALILSRWRTGLSLPLAAMAVATLAAAFPTLFGQAANWPGYLQRALMLWVGIGFGLSLLRWLWLAPGARPWRQRLAAICPWRHCGQRGWEHRLRIDALRQFALAYAAGCPISEAAASATTLCGHPQLAAQWQGMAHSLQAGSDLNQCLPATSLVDARQQQWIRAAEAAGCLDQALWQSVEHSQALIVDEPLTLATWSSRLLLLLGPTATYVWLRLPLAV